MDITHSSEYPEEIESHNSLAILSKPIDDSLEEGRGFGYGGRDCRRDAGDLEEGIEEIFERVGFAGDEALKERIDGIRFEKLIFHTRRLVL